MLLRTGEKGTAAAAPSGAPTAAPFAAKLALSVAHVAARVQANDGRVDGNADSDKRKAIPPRALYGSGPRFRRRRGRHGPKNIASCLDRLMNTALGVMEEARWREFSESGLQTFNAEAFAAFAERPNLRRPDFR